MSTQKKNTQKTRAELTEKLARQQRRDSARHRNIALGITAAALLIVGSLVYFILASGTKTVAAEEQVNPANASSDGVLFTSSTEATLSPARPMSEKAEFTDTTDEEKTHVVLYLDYACHFCAQFEEANSDSLKTWLDDGDITLEIHPVNILGTGTSQRGAEMAAAVINEDPSVFLDVNKALFAKSQEKFFALSDKDMMDVVRASSGLDKAALNRVKDSFADGRFNEWVNNASFDATSETVGIPTTEPSVLTGTPTIIINGDHYQTTFAHDTFTLIMEGIINGEAHTPSEFIEKNNLAVG